MRMKNLIFLLQCADDPRHDSAVAESLRAATKVYEAVPEEGTERRVTVSAPMLRAALIERGLTIVDDEEATSTHGFRRLDNLTRVLVKNGKEVIAMGAASDENDALLHAILGWLREHPIAGLKAPAGIATLPT